MENNYCIGIFSDLNLIDENDLKYLLKQKYLVYIINNNNINKLINNIYYLTPIIFNNLDIKLNYLLIIDDLNYFINWSFKCDFLIYKLKNKLNNINLFENIKKNINIIQIENNEFFESCFNDENDPKIITCDNLEKIIDNYPFDFNLNDYIVELEGYKFIPNMDYRGSDIFNINPTEKNIRELKLISDNLEDCKCFNTWGYFKNDIIEANSIFLKNKYNIIDGLYIKL